MPTRVQRYTAICMDISQSVRYAHIMAHVPEEKFTKNPKKQLKTVKKLSPAHNTRTILLRALCDSCLCNAQNKKISQHVLTQVGYSKDAHRVSHNGFDV